VTITLWRNSLCLVYFHRLRNADMSDFSCLLMHYAMLKYQMSLVFSCSTQCWNIWFHVLRYAEISNVSCITQYWNVWFLIFYGTLKFLVWLAWITFCNNIPFLIITLFWNNCFLLYYVILKYLISHVLRYAEVSGFSCITSRWNIWFLM